jgi:hypothetical protein
MRQIAIAPINQLFADSLEHIFTRIFPVSRRADGMRAGRIPAICECVKDRVRDQLPGCIHVPRHPSPVRILLDCLLAYEYAASMAFSTPRIKSGSPNLAAWKSPIPSGSEHWNKRTTSSSTCWLMRSLQSSSLCTWSDE